MTVVYGYMLKIVASFTVLDHRYLSLLMHFLINSLEYFQNQSCMICRRSIQIWSTNQVLFDISSVWQCSTILFHFKFSFWGEYKSLGLASKKKYKILIMYSTFSSVHLFFSCHTCMAQNFSHTKVVLLLPRGLLEWLMGYSKLTELLFRVQFSTCNT